MKKTFSHKEKGSVIESFLPLTIVIVLVGMLIVQFAGIIKTVDAKNEISLLMRKYTIRMETKGYLTAEDKEALKNELYEIGMTSVDLTGSTTTEVEYGATVYLCLKGRLELETYDITDIFAGHWGMKIINVDEKMSSTSQQ